MRRTSVQNVRPRKSRAEIRGERDRWTTELEQLGYRVTIMGKAAYLHGPDGRPMKIGDTSGDIGSVRALEWMARGILMDRAVEAKAGRRNGRTTV